MDRELNLEDNAHFIHSQPGGRRRFSRSDVRAFSWLYRPRDPLVQPGRGSMASLIFWCPSSMAIPRLVERFTGTPRRPSRIDRVLRVLDTLINLLASFFGGSLRLTT